jgi:hypothetical protein
MMADRPEVFDDMRRVRILHIAAGLLIGSLITLPASANLLHPGMVRVYTAEEITVVYPGAGSTDKVKRNRLSAERRARFLESVHGMKVHVVADRDLEGEKRTGHLFLLGWDNAVLGGPGAERPFSHDEQGVNFIGVTDPDPDTDLVFCHISPFSEEALLCFWSRIDPELDRAMILPTVGSDWAFFGNYTVLAQGNFAENRSWPPARNSEAEMDHRAIIASDRERLRTHRTAHYDVVYDPEAYSADQVRAIGSAREKAFASAVEYLGDPGDGFRVTLFVYTSEDAKLMGSGLPGPASSIPHARELHMTYRFARSPSAHEEVHLVARERLGVTASSALYEGLAVAHDRVVQGHALEVHGAVMLDEDRLPRLSGLLDEEAFRALPDVVGLPTSGLMLAWLYSAFEPAAVRSAYAADDPTLEGVARALGQDPEGLERGFRAFVGERAGPRAAEVAFLAAQKEARERHLAGDYAGIANALRKALEAKPGDPQTVFNLAAAEMRIGDYESAEAHLNAVLANADLPKDHTLKIFSYYQLGRLYDVQGRREEALGSYRKVLALPDRHDSHRSAQDAIEHPVTADALR